MSRLFLREYAGAELPDSRVVPVGGSGGQEESEGFRGDYLVERIEMCIRSVSLWRGGRKWRRET